MNRWLKWETWLHGLIGGAIGGGANAGASWIGMVSAKAAGLDVPTLNLKSLVIICGTSALLAAFLYLKQSPLPEISSITETKITTATATTTSVETATVKSDQLPKPTP